eukprot:scaffold142498_cov21-Prasinocladus_malaysianus.AAC.2
MRLSFHWRHASAEVSNVLLSTGKAASSRIRGCEATPGARLQARGIQLAASACSEKPLVGFRIVMGATAPGVHILCM